MGCCRHPDRQVYEFDILRINRQVSNRSDLEGYIYFLRLRLTVLTQHKLNLVCSQFIN